MAQFPSQSSASGLWTLKKQKRAAQGLNWPPLYGPADDYFEYVTMLLPGNGTNGAQNNTFLDSSTNNFTITRNGNTTQGTFTPYGANWSNYFDGSGDWLQTASNSVFTLATGNFTVEAWVFLPQNNSSTYQGILSSAGVSPNTGFTLSTDLGRAAIGVGNASNADLVTSSSVLPINTWVHIAGVRVGNTLTLYVNGVAQGSVTTTRSINTSEVAVGAYYLGNSPTYPLTGYVSNVRVINSAFYTSNFTPSVAPLTAVAGTILLTCQSNRFIDNSTNNITINRNGDVSVQRFSPFSPTAPYAASTDGGSGYFDGSGDYLNTAYNSAFSLGTGAFTVEAWVYLTAAPPATAGIITLGTGASGSSAYSAWSLFVSPSLIPSFYRYDGTEYVYSSSAALTLNAWSHIAVVRDGSNNFAIFLNGTRVYSATVSQTFANVNTDDLYIARFVSGGGAVPYYPTGYINGCRVIKGSAQYSPTSTTLTVPTSPLTAVTNTSLLLNYTNAGIIDNAEMNNLETVGNAQISTAQSKFGGGSIAFDGTGDYLTTYGTPQFAFGAGDFTIECWVYFNSLTQYDCIIDFRPSGTNGAYPCIFVDTSNTLVYYVGGANRITSSAVSTGQWYHLAVSRTGTSTKMFLNGVQTGSTYTDSNNYLVGNPLTIGGLGYNSPGTYALDGYIDDLRITKGYARYTTNFTPPTAPFPLY